MSRNLVVLSPKEFQAFDQIEKRILSTQELDSLGVNIKPSGQVSDPRYIPLHFTGRFTMEGEPVYENDILAIEIKTEFGSVVEQTGVIVWSPERAQYAITYIASAEGVVYSRITKKLGTIFLNQDLLTKGKKPANE